jgi:hypothetical protein
MATNGKTTTTRLNLDLGPKAKADLVQVSRDTEQSQSETIRAAIALYVTLWSELRSGRKLFIREPDGAGEKEVILPGFRS